MDSIRDAGGRFVKGSPRPKNSGRARGTPNGWKKEIYEDLLKRFSERGFDFVDEFLRLYRAKRTNQEIRARLYLGAANIIFPKKLAVSSVSRVEHIDRQTLANLMTRPDIAKHMEALTFALDERKLLPAPSGERLPILDAEPCDESDPPRATGLGL